MNAIDIEQAGTNFCLKNFSNEIGGQEKNFTHPTYKDE
jgi:hypothetical protein